MTRDSEQCLFARDVATAGYAAAIRKAGADAVSQKFVSEYVSYPVKTLAPEPSGQAARSLRLPILDTPRVPWYDPATQWAIVDDYPSVQAALELRQARRLLQAAPLQDDRRCDGARLGPCRQRHGRRGEGRRVRHRPAVPPDPVLFQDSDMPIRVTARRDVIQRCASGGISNPNGLPVTFYLENVNDNATGDDFCRLRSARLSPGR